MKATLKIQMDNAAFAEAPGMELCKILRDLAQRIEDFGPDAVRLRDTNGNHVGDFKISK